MSQKKNTDPIIIIDYGAGNIRSAAKAFEHVVRENALPYEVKISADPQDLKTASHIVLPGQGAFGDCIKALRASGFIAPLEDAVLRNKTKFLGICVGMQLLVDKGFEHGEHDGLGWISGTCVKMQPTDPSLKIPHMGWNTVHAAPQHDTPHFVLRPESNTKKSAQDFYFVHSYMVQLKERDSLLAVTDYGEPITAAIGRDNIIGVQFHPEKSQNAGLALIQRFLDWTP